MFMDVINQSLDEISRANQKHQHGCPSLQLRYSNVVLISSLMMSDAVKTESRPVAPTGRWVWASLAPRTH